MTHDANDTGSEPVRTAAYAWIVRMHGPDAASSVDAFERWLDADTQHAAVYSDLQAQWDRAKFLTHTKTGQARDLASVAVWYRRPVARLAAVAAALLCVVAAGSVLTPLRQRSSAAPMVAYATRVGEVRTVALADGSNVTLDAESRMQVSIGAGAREARLLDGSARFDVKPDASRAFAIVTGRGTLTTNGGLFDVTRMPGLVRVTAFKGTLTFRNEPVTAGLGSPASLAINTGQRLSLVPERPPQLAAAPQAGARDWTTGMLTFDGERLADAVAELNHHNARKIVLADPTIQDLRITGAFHANDPGGFARAVAAMFALARRDRDGATELSRKK